MNMKKAGLVTAGVVTALLAASPMAFAGDWGHGHGPGHDQVCTFTGGDAAADSAIHGGPLPGANTVTQNPDGGSVDSSDDNCSNEGNNSDNGNESGNVLTQLLPLD